MLENVLRSSNYISADIQICNQYRYLSDDERSQVTNKFLFPISRMTLLSCRDRRPSYTDRILVSNMSTDLQILRYSSMNDIKMSDHRPVFADFLLQRQVNGDKSMQQTVNILEAALSEIFS